MTFRDDELGIVAWPLISPFSTCKWQFEESDKSKLRMSECVAISPSQDQETLPLTVADC